MLWVLLAALILLASVVDLALLGDDKDCSQKRTDGGQPTVGGQPLLPPRTDLRSLVGKQAHARGARYKPSTPTRASGSARAGMTGCTSSSAVTSVTEREALCRRWVSA